MFWDTMLLRFHFGFGIAATGLEYVGRAMSTAYTPRQRLFAVFPSGPTHLPQLSDFSVWLLAEDCPETTLLGRHVHQRLNELTLRNPPLRPDIASFPARLQANASVDAAPSLAAARQEDNAGAVEVVGSNFRRRMIEFRARVWIQSPVALMPATLRDFAYLWNLYSGSRQLPVEDFPLAWFSPDIENILTCWPGHPSWFSWNDKPIWIDHSEWSFLRGCYNSSVSPVDRLALFLLIYGALNVPQITRLFRLLREQTGWTFPLNAAGYTAAMDHLVHQWTAVLRYMARTRAVGAASN